MNQTIEELTRWIVEHGLDKPKELPAEVGIYAELPMPKYEPKNPAWHDSIEISLN